jgi:hypothetical protein
MRSILKTVLDSLICPLFLQAILLFITPVSTVCQSLKGTITEDGKIPIPFATIYIDKTHSGTTANVNGEYELPLDSGFYHIKFRAIGYKTLSKEIRIRGKSEHLNIILPLEAFQLKEVVVRPNGENLARVIMRKAIAWAPYYLNYVQHYASEVYLKGSMQLDNIPRILASRMMIRIDNKQIKPYSGMMFIDESVNEVSFDSPDHFIQKVKSARSTMPGLGGQPISPMELIKENFYQPQLMDCMSPLNINAFANYQFVYEGYSEEDNFLIYKIKVIPRRKSQQLFSGTIYIVDQYWCLYSVSLSVEQFWGNVIINQVYTQFEGSAWLPMSHSFFFDASYLGIKGTYKYSAAVKYKDIRVNQSLQGPIKEVPPQAKTNTIAQTKLAEADKLNSRQMRKLVRKNRVIAKDQKRDSTNSLELKPHVKIIVEPGAVKQDSSYWNAIRPIPLSREDIKGYAKFDSIVFSQQKSKTGDSASHVAKKSHLLGKIFLVNISHYRDSTVQLKYFGLLNPRCFLFNTVDGWQYHQYLELLVQPDSNHEFKLAPAAAYAFGRNTLLATIEGSYSYAPLMRGELFVQAGSTSSDFNSISGINPYVNSLTSLFFRKNYMKLFDYNYLTLGNKIDLSNGLELTTKASYRQFNDLTNNSNFSLFYSDSRKYSANIPDNILYKADSSNSGKSFLLSLNLEFTPEYYYFFRNNKKVMFESKYPTFNLGLNYAIPISAKGNSSFRSLELGIKQTLDFGYFSMFRYSLRIGSFLNTTHVAFPDYYHFNTQPQGLMVGTFYDSYQLLDYYRFSTDNEFIDIHVQYRNQLLLLKRLPLISNRIWSENIYLKYLSTPQLHNYLEVGYAVGNIMGIVNIGVFSGFENFRYKATQVKFCLGIDRNH